MLGPACGGPRCTGKSGAACPFAGDRKGAAGGQQAAGRVAYRCTIADCIAMLSRSLKTFLTVARTLNFTRAAEEVHLAQSSVSDQIQALETELGVGLFT